MNSRAVFCLCVHLHVHTQLASAQITVLSVSNTSNYKAQSSVINLALRSWKYNFTLVSMETILAYYSDLLSQPLY